MYEIDYKMIKRGFKLPYIFVCIGFIIATLFLGFFFYDTIRYDNYNSSISTDYIDPNGHLNSENTYVYNPKYHFTVKGRRYVCESSVSSLNPPKMQGIVYYNHDDPDNCIIDYQMVTPWFFLIGVVIGGIFILIGVFMLRNNSNKIKKYKYLEKHGKLYKGVQYKMESTNMSIGRKTIKKIVVNYTKQDGTTIRLDGNPRYDFKERDEDGLVDLLIDPNDVTNYYIDFEIKEKGKKVEEPVSASTTPPIVPTTVSATIVVPTAPIKIENVENVDSTEQSKHENNE